MLWGRWVTSLQPVLSFSLVNASAAGFIRWQPGPQLAACWARQVLFPCLESWTSSRESVAHCLMHESKEEHLTEWQVACVAHVAREGHLMSAESCMEACEQPLWLRSKLDPKRLVKKNLLVVCELRGVQLRMWCLATPEQIKLEFTASPSLFSHGTWQAGSQLGWPCSTATALGARRRKMPGWWWWSLSLVAWGRQLVTLLSQGLAHLLLQFVVRDSEKSWPAAGMYVKWSRQLELPLKHGTGESPK